MQKHRSLLLLLLVYCLCVLTVFVLWTDMGHHGVSGDEPHYLVMANGLARHGALEQTPAYADALRPGQPEKFGLPREARQAPEYMHTVSGPRGLFNIHNLGLPLLLALPFALGGIAGAKAFMMLCGALAVLFAWKIAGHFTSDQRQRWLAVCAACIGMPLLPAATQIYPDVLAGVLALVGLYWFCTTRNKRAAGAELLLAAAVAYLPWLQIKFGPACALIVLAVAAKIHAESKDFKRLARILAVAGISCLALVAYNMYAFGKPSGPYLPDALAVNPTSLMVLLGLLIDQNQGFLMQNPVHLAGLLGIGWLYRANRPLALLWALVFLSLIVPNALHPNWYGGASFSGRFGWAAAVVFVVPTIHALLELAKRRGQAFQAIVWLALLLQLYLFSRYAFTNLGLNNRDAVTPFASYSLFYSPIHDWLPGLYNANWAYTYAPNYAWLTLAGLLLAAGFARRLRLARLGAFGLALYAGSAVMLASGAPGQPPKGALFPAAGLPSQTGRIDGSTLVAQPGVHAAGFINFGPYLSLPRSSYRVTIKYRSAGPRSESAALFEIYDPALQQQLLAKELDGTDGAPGEYSAEFRVSYLRNQPTLEFRNRWKGKQEFTLYEISVIPL